MEDASLDSAADRVIPAPVDVSRAELGFPLKTLAVIAIASTDHSVADARAKLNTIAGAVRPYQETNSSAPLWPRTHLAGFEALSAHRGRSR